MIIISFLALVAGLLIAWGAVKSQSKECPFPQLQQNFQTKPYLGKWYDFAHLPNKFQQGECSTATYNLKSNGEISVYNEQVLTTGWDSILGSASCESDNSGQCWVRFSKFAPKGDYRVISTDYTSYSIVYSCSKVLDAYQLEYAWVLARKAYVPGTAEHTAFKQKVYAIIAEKIPSFDTNRLAIQRQGPSCGYLA